MATTQKKTAVKAKAKKPVKAVKTVKSASKKTNTSQKNQSKAVRAAQKVSGPSVRRFKGFMARRPHRSFRMTRRRDYVRSFKLPGYWNFTGQVFSVLIKNWRLFGGLVLVSIIATIVISGFGAQETYSNLSTTLKESSGDLFKGDFGAVGQASLLLVGTITTGLTPNLTQAQSVLGGLAVFFGWLVTIWLLRNTLAGHHPRLRDGLYNSGSPVLATVIVGFIMTLQLLPGAVAAIVYSAAATSGLMEGGVSAMLVWCGVILLSLISVYWLSSSFIALVIVTLPGMYPMRAIKAAGDLVVGRRLRILFRMAWLLFIVLMLWALIVIPVILFDDWIKSLVPAINWLPLVPLVIIAMSSLSLIFTTSYTYLLYRRIVDDDDTPA